MPSRWCRSTASRSSHDDGSADRHSPLGRTPKARSVAHTGKVRCWLLTIGQLVAIVWRDMPAERDPAPLRPSSHHLTHAAGSARRERDERMVMADFADAPFTIAWEVTRACAYACAHCRPDAQPRRDSRELGTDEALTLIDDLAGFGNRPILVLTGGDPLMRRDLFTLARHADERGLRVSLTPTATALTTPARMRLARDAGVRRGAVRADGAAAPTPQPLSRF